MIMSGLKMQTHGNVAEKMIQIVVVLVKMVVVFTECIIKQVVVHRRIIIAVIKKL